jgi:hypothetical protein
MKYNLDQKVLKESHRQEIDIIIDQSMTEQIGSN